MITVVSGLPRSGTSLVMQMLAAGGYPILCDDRRPADDDNPRGYLEYARVKSLEHDASWLDQAEGKAVKIISPLLASLPAHHDYRIIFLQRDLGEVLRSQAIMLQRRGQPPGPSAEVMQAHFERHLQTVESWLSRQSHIRTLNCQFTDLMRGPLNMAAMIAQFLEGELNLTEMAAAVEPTLHRQRKRSE